MKIADRRGRRQRQHLLPSQREWAFRLSHRFEPLGSGIKRGGIAYVQDWELGGDPLAVGTRAWDGVLTGFRSQLMNVAPRSRSTFGTMLRMPSVPAWKRARSRNMQPPRHRYSMALWTWQPHWRLGCDPTFPMLKLAGPSTFLERGAQQAEVLRSSTSMKFRSRLQQTAIDLWGFTVWFTALPSARSWPPYIQRCGMRGRGRPAFAAPCARISAVRTSSFCCRRYGGVANEETCPYGPEQRLDFSGTLLRRLLAERRAPDALIRPEVAEIILSIDRAFVE